MTTADDIIVWLNLKPHPEGGFFRETFRQQPQGGARGSFALIYYLLPGTHRSAWHRIDATEVWQFVCGDPLRLTLFSDNHGHRRIVVGARLEAEENPNVVVEPWTWMTAVSLGAWTLVSCTTVPAFDYAGFELAPPNWQPDAQ